MAILLRAGLAGLALLCAAAAAAVDLYDDFERADGSELGDGWLEKQAAGFVLQAGGAAKQPVASGYLNNLVYRPAAEDTRDTEAWVAVRWLGTAIGYPQLAVRLQADRALPDQASGYLLFVANVVNEARLRRLQGYGFVDLATLSLAEPLGPGALYRLRLRAVGEAPVRLTAWVERQAESGAWITLGQAAYEDGTPGRHAGPGGVGFGGHVEGGYRYEAFGRLDLDGAAGDPPPWIGAVDPAVLEAGGPATTLTVTGGGFTAESVAQLDGAPRTTRVLLATQLEVDLSAADLAAAGERTLTIYTPPPGGGLSAGWTLRVTVPPGPVAPRLSALEPAEVTAGGSAFALTVRGENFVPGAVVRVDGADRPTTFLDGATLSAAVPAEDLAEAGTRRITVAAPDGTVSDGLDLLVRAPAGSPPPRLDAVEPPVLDAGGPGRDLTLRGADFAAGAEAELDGAPRPTVRLDANTLQVALSAADLALPGVRMLRVRNPAPGGGLSGAASLTLNDAGSGGLQLVRVAPRTLTADAGAATVFAYGGGFGPNTELRWDGVALPTTVLDENTLRAEVDAARLAAPARPALAVYDPDRAAWSAPQPLFVLADGDRLFFDDFERADGAALGNDWTEKWPDAFALAGGRVVSIDSTPRGFNDVIVYRPVAEDAADVESGLEFLRSDGADPRFPQVHVRAQRDTLAEPNGLISYTAFLYDQTPLRLTITTIWDFQECYLAQFPLAEPLQVGARYRLRLRALGTTAVRLTAHLERYAAGAWRTVSTGTVIHDADTTAQAGLWCSLGSMPSPDRFGSGATGFAKYIYRTDPYDHFYSIALAGAGNEPPVIASLLPASAPAGGSGFELTVNGSGFAPESQILIDGVARPTTYRSPLALGVVLDAADLAVPGTRTIEVVTPPPGGGSASAVFAVVASGGELYDDFSRTDNEALGNGWIERQPAAFRLRGGAVGKRPSSGSYRETLVYRPHAEDALDVEASVRLRFDRAAFGYPQIYTRIQAASTATADRLDGYILYIDNDEARAVLGRQRGVEFVTPLAVIRLSEPLDTENTFRLRLRSTGRTPVQLEAYVERLDDGVWSVLGGAAVADADAQRIDTAGSVGFGGYVEEGYRYDDFRRRRLDAP